MVVEQTIHELRKIVLAYSQKLRAIDHATFTAKPNPTKWSKQEVLGHLIDSAQNNLRRFICCQYEKTPQRIVYDQNFWVHANKYVSQQPEDVIENWRLVNLQICIVLENTPDAHYDKETNTGKEVIELHTLSWLAQDYVKHLKHHLNQIIPHSFDITYP